MDINKSFANRDVSNLIICDYNTGAPFINLDYANVTTTDLTGEVVYAYGGQGHPKKISFSGDRGGTMTIETQIQETKLYKLITGSSITTDAVYIQSAEKVVASGANEFYLERNAEVANASYPFVVKKDNVVLQGTVSKSSADGKYKYTWTPGTDAIAKGDNLVVFFSFQQSAGAEKIAVKSDTFPSAVKIYADTWDKSEDDSIIDQKMVVYKATAQPNFSLSNQNTGDPVSLTMTFDIMEDGNHDILDLIFKNRG